MSEYVELKDGPLEGKVVRNQGLSIEGYTLCDCEYELCMDMDTVAYDREGNFQEIVCEHPIVKIETFEDCCDLCPGHRTHTGETRSHR